MEVGDRNQTQSSKRDWTGLGQMEWTEFGLDCHNQNKETNALPLVPLFLQREQPTGIPKDFIDIFNIYITCIKS